jgi:hypothetical protein
MRFKILAENQNSAYETKRESGTPRGKEQGEDGGTSARLNTVNLRDLGSDAQGGHHGPRVNCAPTRNRRNPKQGKATPSIVLHPPVGSTNIRASARSPIAALPWQYGRPLETFAASIHQE